jgi:hypothetical protein
LDYHCNFYRKLFSTFILETKNDTNLFVKNENEETLYCLPPSEMQSSRFMKRHFNFHLGLAFK